ncbi:TPA: hypothetical protein HA270_04050 [Candidatus Woesearchaeota archaeon]|nr:hypothetical protein [Candidatus Woesearchaeota archaeon]
MGRKTVALSLDEAIYENHQKYCEKHSMILSRKVEKFMEAESKKKRDDND